MTGETNKMQIRVVDSEIPQEEADRALFALFDLLLGERATESESSEQTIKNKDGEQSPISAHGQ